MVGTQRKEASASTTWFRSNRVNVITANRGATKISECPALYQKSLRNPYLWLRISLFTVGRRDDAISTNTQSLKGTSRTRLEGPHFRLVPFDESMIDDRYLSWLVDPEVIRFLEVRHQPQTRETATAFVRSFDGPAEKYMWSIVPKDSDAHIGTCTLYHINRNHGSAEIGLLIGDRNYWGKGASEEAIGLLADHAFDTLGLHRLTGGSSAKNRGMNFTYRKIGFTLEGRMREAQRIRPGEYVDGYRWGLLADEWRARRS